MKTIQVDLRRNNYSYQVKIGNNNLAENLRELLIHHPKANLFVVTNETVDKLYPDFMECYIPSGIACKKLILPDGEQYKNLKSISKIYDFLAENSANRKSILIAFGGGVIGDMTGYAAATFMRGISFVQIPTTLLSQVDSSIGGKTGVNHQAGKNFIGSFKQPLQTVIDVNFLSTLPSREFTAGYGELVKHGFIHDAFLFQQLKKTDLKTLGEDKEMLSNVIFRSCEVKARVVERDEKESNQRAILNFGHTLGHCLETLTKYEKFLHGEALIPGMDFASWWSCKRGYLDRNDFQLIHDHLASLGVSLEIPKVEKEVFKRIIEHDKKSDVDGVRFIGLAGIGNARIFDQISSDSLWEDFQRYMNEETALLRFQ